MKQSLVFLNGGPGFQDYLELYFQDLNSFFDCHFYDQLQGSTVGLEDLIQQLLQKVGPLSKPILIGHSWGGVLATEFALRYQEKIGGIVLMCSALSNLQWLEYRKDLQNMNLENASPDKIFLVPSDGEEGRNLLDKTWKTFSVETFDGLNESYIVNFDLTKKLSQISIKILNIYAEHDLRIPMRVAKSFRSFNPAIVDYQISDCGHFPFIQAQGREKIYQILRSSL